MDRPFLVNAFKLNMRRYVLIVCSGTSHLRAYVHQNGKNFYTKLPYRELSRTTPKFDWKNDNGASKMVLDEIITTAYNIPENHYHDKPMTNRNFFRLLDEKRINYTTFLQSLHTRIALSLHMASFNNSNAFGVCETRTTPECLSQALRSIHVACDFHVEQPTMMDGEEVLIGSKSLLFECNRGPDMNPHDPEDGALKREVSSDFVSLLGFSGELNDSEEILDRYQLAKVYDSHHFDSEKALGFLQSLSLLEQERTSKLELK